MTSIRKLGHDPRNLMSFKKFAGQNIQYLNTLGILSTLHFSRYFKLGSKMDELDVEPKAHSRRERQ